MKKIAYVGFDYQLNTCYQEKLRNFSTIADWICLSKAIIQAFSASDRFRNISKAEVLRSIQSCPAIFHFHSMDKRTSVFSPLAFLKVAP